MELKDYLKIAGVTKTVNVEEELNKFFGKNTKITESDIDVLVHGLGIESKAFYSKLYEMFSSMVLEMKSCKCGEPYDMESDDMKCSECGAKYPKSMMKEDDDEADDDDEAEDDVEYPVGKHAGTEESVDAGELAMGIEVEMEHTDNKDISKQIALDHLAEHPDYYTKLASLFGTEGASEDFDEVQDEAEEEEEEED